MKRLLLICISVLTTIAAYGQSGLPKTKEVPGFTPGMTVTLHLDPATGEYVEKQELRQRYNGKMPNIVSERKNTPRSVIEKSAVKFRPQTYRWKLNTTHTVVGSCMIGGALTTALLSSAILSEKTSYNSNPAETQRIIYYTCAGVSLAGAIVILTGLHKEYDRGVSVSGNWRIEDSTSGLALTKRF